MSATASPAPGTTTTAAHPTSDTNWWPWVIALVATIVHLAIFYQIGGYERFNWTSILWTLLPYGLFALGYILVLDSDCHSGSLGGAGNIAGIALCGAAVVIIVITYMPSHWIKDHQQIAHPLKGRYELKPYVAPTTDPQMLPELQWFTIDFAPASDPTKFNRGYVQPTASDKAFVQIQMTVGQAKAGFPVLKEISNNRGKIVVWYENATNNTESRTGDY
jgi:hypothetical protein